VETTRLPTPAPPDSGSASLALKRDLPGRAISFLKMETEDGLGYTLPFNKGWEHVKTACCKANISHAGDFANRWINI
jgi:hypothetical protein